MQLPSFKEARARAHPAAKRLPPKELLTQAPDFDGDTFEDEASDELKGARDGSISTFGSNTFFSIWTAIQVKASLLFCKAKPKKITFELQDVNELIQNKWVLAMQSNSSAIDLVIEDVDSDEDAFTTLLDSVDAKLFAKFGAATRESIYAIAPPPKMPTNTNMNRDEDVCKYFVHKLCEEDQSELLEAVIDAELAAGHNPTTSRLSSDDDAGLCDEDTVRFSTTKIPFPLFVLPDEAGWAGRWDVSRCNLGLEAHCDCFVHCCTTKCLLHTHSLTHSHTHTLTHSHTHTLTHLHFA